MNEIFANITMKDFIFCQNQKGNCKRLPKINICDGISDCYNGTDEQGCLNCTKAFGRSYKCQGINTKCINTEKVCNGRRGDCPNGRDESDCEICPSERPYKCKGHATKCIYLHQICDGRFDCPIRDDEYQCATCSVNLYHKYRYDKYDLTQCPNKKCFFIYFRHICDGRQNFYHTPVYHRYYTPCSGGEEKYCEKCPEERPLKCKGTKSDCITIYELCDTMLLVKRKRCQCEGCTDENICTSPCPEGTWQCQKSSQCISNVYYCDKLEIDCKDGTDEGNFCENQCSKDEFKCTSGIGCVSNYYLCDSVLDCSDSSDEIDCDCETHDDLVACPGSGCGKACIPEMWICDGHPDCPGSTDEKDCKNNVISASKKL